MSVSILLNNIKDLSKLLIVNSLISGELFHCLKCEKEIKYDSQIAEFTTHHILIDEAENSVFLCSTCFNQNIYRPVNKKAYFYLKCGSPKCIRRFYIPLDQKGIIKFCSDACEKGDRPILKKDQLYPHQAMLWQGQGYVLYTFTETEWCIVKQIRQKVWKIDFHVPVSLESIENLAKLESAISGEEPLVIQKKITSVLQHTIFQHVVKKKPRRDRKK